MRTPSVLIGFGSGREGWLSIDLDTLRFRLEIENGRRSEETLTLAELKRRLPGPANLIANILAEAVRTDRELGQ